MSVWTQPMMHCVKYAERRLSRTRIFRQKGQNLRSSTYTLEEVVQRCSVKKGVLRNFGKFTGKHLCQRLLGLQLY